MWNNFGNPSTTFQCPPGVGPQNPFQVDVNPFDGHVDWQNNSQRNMYSNNINPNNNSYISEFYMNTMTLPQQVGASDRRVFLPTPGVTASDKSVLNIAVVKPNQRPAGPYVQENLPSHQPTASSSPVSTNGQQQEFPKTWTELFEICASLPLAPASREKLLAGRKSIHNFCTLLDQFVQESRPHEKLLQIMSELVRISVAENFFGGFKKYIDALLGQGRPRKGAKIHRSKRLRLLWILGEVHRREYDGCFKLLRQVLQAHHIFTKFLQINHPNTLLEEEAIEMAAIYKFWKHVATPVVAKVRLPRLRIASTDFTKVRIQCTSMDAYYNAPQNKKRSARRSSSRSTRKNFETKRTVSSRSRSPSSPEPAPRRSQGGSSDQHFSPSSWDELFRMILCLPQSAEARNRSFDSSRRLSRLFNLLEEFLEHRRPQTMFLLLVTELVKIASDQKCVSELQEFIELQLGPRDTPALRKRNFRRGTAGSRMRLLWILGEIQNKEYNDCFTYLRQRLRPAQLFTKFLQLNNPNCLLLDEFKELAAIYNYWKNLDSEDTEKVELPRTSFWRNLAKVTVPCQSIESYYDAPKPFDVIKIPTQRVTPVHTDNRSGQSEVVEEITLDDPKESENDNVLDSAWHQDEDWSTPQQHHAQSCGWEDMSSAIATIRPPRRAPVVSQSQLEESVSPENEANPGESLPEWSFDYSCFSPKTWSELYETMRKPPLTRIQANKRVDGRESFPGFLILLDQFIREPRPQDKLLQIIIELVKISSDKKCVLDFQNFIQLQLGPKDLRALRKHNITRAEAGLRMRLLWLLGEIQWKTKYNDHFKGLLKLLKPAEIFTKFLHLNNPNGLKSSEFQELAAIYNFWKNVAPDAFGKVTLPCTNKMRNLSKFKVPVKYFAMNRYYEDKKHIEVIEIDPSPNTSQEESRRSTKFCNEPPPLNEKEHETQKLVERLLTETEKKNIPHLVKAIENDFATYSKYTKGEVEHFVAQFKHDIFHSQLNDQKVRILWPIGRIFHPAFSRKFALMKEYMKDAAVKLFKHCSVMISGDPNVWEELRVIFHVWQRLTFTTLDMIDELKTFFLMKKRTDPNSNFSLLLDTDNIQEVVRVSDFYVGQYLKPSAKKKDKGSEGKRPREPEVIVLEEQSPKSAKVPRVDPPTSSISFQPVTKMASKSGISFSGKTEGFPRRPTESTWEERLIQQPKKSSSLAKDTPNTSLNNKNRTIGIEDILSFHVIPTQPKKAVTPTGSQITRNGETTSGTETISRLNLFRRQMEQDAAVSSVQFRWNNEVSPEETNALYLNPNWSVNEFVDHVLGEETLTWNIEKAKDGRSYVKIVK